MRLLNSCPEQIFSCPPDSLAEADKAMFEAVNKNDASALRAALRSCADPLLLHPVLDDTALHIAAYNNHIECLRELLPISNPDVIGSFKMTPLMAAARCGHLEATLELIPKSNAKLQNVRGLTALMLAACNGFHECAKALLPCSDTSQTDDCGRTALHLALTLSDGPLETARILIACSDIEQPDKFGRTALMAAAAQGRYDCCSLLLPSPKTQPTRTGTPPTSSPACAGTTPLPVPSKSFSPPPASASTSNSIPRKPPAPTRHWPFN